ncbi:recombinase family protein [Amycolatopsis taiwanensis]|uniref:Recombinase domain-containing protein n=1 Tax=Amycolatopsis taiwanensis TaxID=342230 RepID=A0A9W6RBG5_9PSEU|nr:recombinase family protein [Amycolatopsis taiwanensis]GLY71685.1 hypothetical protein Atai01_83040 [Amycolatopsis taiwanensis]
MTTKAAPQELDHDPHPDTTAVRSSRSRRLAARLLRASHRWRTNDTSRVDAATMDVPWPVRQQVLREYHAANLSRARHASEEMVRAGFNTGAVPYGYRALRARVTPAGKRPRWRTRLAIEPVEAATVKMIFVWRAEDRLSIAEIYQRLRTARYPAPLDPDTGQPGMWTHTVIAAILRNPKYQGRQIWGRRHHGRPAPRARWVWSPAWAHPPIVSAELFAAANQRARPAA